MSHYDIEECWWQVLMTFFFVFNSWVMLSGSDGFIHLPKEHVIFTSPPRTSLSIKPPTSYSGTESSFLVSSSAGCIYLTNQRVRTLHLTPPVLLARSANNCGSGPYVDCLPTFTANPSVSIIRCTSTQYTR